PPELPAPHSAKVGTRPLPHLSGRISNHGQQPRRLLPLPQRQRNAGGRIARSHLCLFFSSRTKTVQWRRASDLRTGQDGRGELLQCHPGTESVGGVCQWAVARNHCGAVSVREIRRQPFYGQWMASQIKDAAWMAWIEQLAGLAENRERGNELPRSL